MSQSLRLLSTQLKKVIDRRCDEQKELKQMIQKLGELQVKINNSCSEEYGSYKWLFHEVITAKAYSIFIMLYKSSTLLVSYYPYNNKEHPVRLVCIDFLRNLFS